jgi:hypothetical protein
MFGPHGFLIESVGATNGVGYVDGSSSRSLNV